MKANELLLDGFGRIHEIVAATLEDIDPELLVRRVADQANPIAWLVWHLSRGEDAQIAPAAGLEQVWTSQGFAGRFGLSLPVQDTGYGHTSEQVDAVQAPPELLRDYYDAVHRQSVGFLESLSDEELDRVVDTRWKPPVTLGVRLVSILADCLQHAGQAAYVKGAVTETG
ncbi:mycothiol transferase [Arthrobacter sp. YAF16]|uniref:mycothiol transferase n=1 Tax=Arthrobacter sp. YAF16 TaxID=3233076 RepID=UPI003F939951